MKAKLLSAWGYQGDAMNLPVADAENVAAFYVEKMGFDIVELREDPHKAIVLERDGIRMALTENGGDPEQDGCAFRTDNVEALRNEFISNGLANIGVIDEEAHENEKFRVFFVVAPDGLCFWFGESLAGKGSTAKKQENCGKGPRS